ncbi:MAG: alpha/beta hydrolase [Rikenellaceae bacterium]
MAELQHKFALANDTAIRFIDSRQGDKVVVFIHGYLETADIWEDILEALKSKCRVIAFDIPGHGISETRHQIHTMEYVADTLQSLLVQLDIKKCTLVGHSMGGYVALAFAKKYNEMLSGLVLFHSTPDADTPEKKANREREINIISSGRKEMLAKSNPGNTFAKVNRAYYSEVIDDLTRNILETDDDGIIALLKGMAQREDMNTFLEEMSQPLMFIFGMADDYIPVSYAKELVARHPKASVVWLENSGHMGIIEDAEASIAALTEFVDKIK